MSSIKHFHKDVGGQATIMTAVCLLCLVGFLGLATDVGLLFRDKVNLQKVADAAAIAGASQLTSGQYVAAARASATRNGVTDGVNGTVTVTLGTTYHPNAVKVHVTQSRANIFMSLFGVGTTTVGATAAAGITNGNGDGCMFAMDTKPAKDQGITMNGTGDLEVPNCAIYDNSGLTMDGNSGKIKAKYIGVAGDYTGHGGASPDPITGMVPVADPMKYWNTPPPFGTACAADPKKSSGSVSPGCYNGLTLNGAVSMSPGLYVVNGALNLNGVTATGVTFYLDGNKASLGSVNNSNLTAPTSGTPGTCTAGGGCNGMLIWDTESTKKAQQGVSFGPGSSTLTGVMYFPNADLKFHGNNDTTLNAVVVAQSYVFDGTVNINNYPIGANQPPIILTPTLVE